MDNISDRTSIVHGQELDPQASCYRKTRLPAEEIARRRANELGLEYYGCDICGGWHLTKRAISMATIDLKSFLRQNGFRHIGDGDRGATWGNGVVKVFVDKTLQSGREPGKVRALMDQVREAARKKTAQDKAEEQRLQAKAEKMAAQGVAYQPRTPEQIRQEQIAAGCAIAAAEQKASPAPPPSPAQAPSPPPAPVTAATTPEKKITRAKFKGEERVYVFGRLKAMIYDAKWDDERIARELQAEGLRQPNGKAMDSKYVAKMRGNWKMRPEVPRKYPSIMYPRLKTGATTPAPRPAAPAIAPRTTISTTTVNRSRFNLPLTVDAVLADPEVSDQDKLQILFIFVEVPDAARPLIDDKNFSVQQKMAVIEALGKRRTPAPANN